MTILRGIDVSVYQPSTPALGGLSFLIARASIGVDRDARYRIHIANARRAGLVVGAYHFGFTHLSIDRQVKTFLDAAGDVDLYALDVEGQAAPTRSQTRAFVKGVQAAGHKIGLYHSESGFFDAGQDWDWVARWSPTPPRRHWDVWQHRGSPLDLDRFNGGVPALHRLAGIPIAPDTAAGTLWSPDVPAAIRKLDPGGTSVMTWVKRTGHDPESRIGMGDLERAFERAGIDYGTVVNPSDMPNLRDWRPT